jgi:hypothetical protein
MADDRGTLPPTPPMRVLLAACDAARVLSTPPAVPDEDRPDADRPGPDRRGDNRADRPDADHRSGRRRPGGQRDAA